MEQTANSIRLRGQLASMPEPSHENHGKSFYRFYLNVQRLSGVMDCLPIIVESQLLSRLEITEGTMIAVTGQIRSHNIRSEERRHLLVFVFATEMEIEDGEPVNEVVLEGNLCRDATYRKTPLGREICDIMLAVPRSFGRADYLPCILWGRTALQASLCQTRERVRIYGRMQSRTYIKVIEQNSFQRTTYEISAMNAEFPDSET